MNSTSKLFSISMRVALSFLVVMPLLAGCGGGESSGTSSDGATVSNTSNSGSTKSVAKADLAMFETWAKEFVAEPHTNVLLPDAEKWFTEHFERELAEQLAAEYRLQAKGVDQLPQFVAGAKAEGNTEVLVAVYSEAIDVKANGLQNAALQRMTKPVDLFTLRLVQPGETSGSSLWSFVYVDGEFRFAGKMTALNPTQGDLVTDILCQMPLGEIEATMKEQGLLEKSAVDHLKEAGVLQ